MHCIACCITVNAHPDYIQCWHYIMWIMMNEICMCPYMQVCLLII